MSCHCPVQNFPVVSLCREWNLKLLSQLLGSDVIGSWILLHPNFLLHLSAPATMVWRHTKHDPTSGPLHLLYSVPICSSFSHISVFCFIRTCSNVSSSEKPYPGLSEAVSLLFPIWLTCLIFNHLYHYLKLIIFCVFIIWSLTRM